VGNLGVISSAEIYKPPDRDSFVVEGPRALHINPRDGSVVEAVFGPVNWGSPEKSRWEYWRWGLGDATVTLRNPQPFTIESRVSFRLRAVVERKAIVALAGRVIWQGTLQPAEVRPGDTVLTFTSDRPPGTWGTTDKRKLTFSLRDLDIELVRQK
jgi:hypothetical protein